MTPPIDLYRRYVPLPVRKCLHTARIVAYRRPLASARVLLGRPVARTRLADGVLYVDLRDRGVGRPLFTRGLYEYGETRFFRSLLRPGMTFVDIGANIGYYSVIASRALGPAGRVLAVEPEPYNASLLRANLSANGLANVTVAQVALGGAEGTAELYCSGDNYGDHRLSAQTIPGRKHTTTRVTTLDRLLADHAFRAVDLVKMDVQGYEAQVVAGMAGVIAANPGLTVLTEFWPYGIQSAGGCPHALLEFFGGRDLAPHTVDLAGDLRAVEPAELHELADRLVTRTDDCAYVNLVFRRR